MPRRLSNWLDTYLTYTDNTETPSHFHLLVGVSVLASVLRRNVWFDMRKFNWYPNFYIVLVAPPGVVNKSTTIDIGVKLLKSIPSLKLGPKSITWQSLIDLLAECRVTGVVDGFFKPTCCLTLAPRELGTILRTADHEAIDVLTDLYDSIEGKWERRTRTQGESTVVNPLLNLIGATTPAWLTDNFSRGSLEAGLGSRILFSFAEKKRKYSAFIEDGISREQEKKLEENLMEDLKEVATLRGPFSISPSAKTLVQKWYQEHWEIIEKGGGNYGVTGYGARKQGHLMKLAMVHSVSRGDSMDITEEDINFGLGFLREIEKDMDKAFSTVGKTDLIQAQLDIVELIKSLGDKGGMLYEIYRKHFYHKLSSQEFLQVVMGARDARHIFIKTQGNDRLLVYNKELENENT